LNASGAFERIALVSEPPVLSVLVPVYNEAGTILTLIDRVRRVPISKEIIVVDDASTDGTRQLLQTLATAHNNDTDDRIVLLSHDRNQGKGAAIRTAVALATGTLTVIQDADLEYDPKDYLRLIRPILDGYADVVYGSRFSGSPRRVLMFWHTVANRILTLFSNVCTNLNLTDMETGYKIFRTEILKRIPIRSNRFGFEPEITAKVATLRCRVYEVPISYHGRQYSEGKKIGWKDAFSAIWTMLRFTLVADVGRQDAGFTTLQRVETLRRYNDFMWTLMKPFVGRRILEVGSGTGLLTGHLASRGAVMATDLDGDYVELLRRRYADSPNVSVRQLDVTKLGDGSVPNGSFDTVICSNVLEHTEDDGAALSAIREALEPEGRVVLVVPAIKAIYGEIDRAIHHHRRYSRREIETKLRAAGLSVEHLSYFNMLGVPGWYLNSKVLRRKTVPGIQAKINDRLVPLLRLERRFGPPIGMSIIAVGQRTPDADERVSSPSP
jgi:glycosyltransferase involved in cell wall biosynthesis